MDFTAKINKINTLSPQLCSVLCRIPMLYLINLVHPHTQCQVSASGQQKAALLLILLTLTLNAFALLLSSCHQILFCSLHSILTAAALESSSYFPTIFSQPHQVPLKSKRVIRRRYLSRFIPSPITPKLILRRVGRRISAVAAGAITESERGRGRILILIIKFKELQYVNFRDHATYGVKYCTNVERKPANYR